MNWPGISIVLLLPGLAADATLSAHTRQTSQSRSRPRAALPASALGRAAKPQRACRAFRQVAPLSFEANRGQTDQRVKFLARGPGYTLFLSPKQAVLALKNFPVEGKPAPAMQWRACESQKPTVTAVRIELVGGSPDARLTGLEEPPGKSNDFIGSDPHKWRTNVPAYGRVQARGIYPGIDLVYYGRQRELEEDFLVAPGADPRAIILEIETGKSKFEARTIHVDATGDLVVETDAGAEASTR